MGAAKVESDRGGKKKALFPQCQTEDSRFIGKARRRKSAKAEYSLRLGVFATLRFCFHLSQFLLSMGVIPPLQGPLFEHFVPFRGISIQVTIHEQLTRQTELSKSSLIKPNQVIFYLSRSVKWPCPPVQAG
jgi:hypothetical protein